MKRVFTLLLLMIIALTGFSVESEQKSMTLEDLYYNNGLMLSGINNSVDLFFPIPFSSALSDAVLELDYAFTQIAGPESKYSVYVDDEPLLSERFVNREGTIEVSIPDNRVQAGEMLKVSLHVALDYLECDSENTQREALWFRLFKESALSFQHVPEPAVTIPGFFSVFNPDREFVFRYDDWGKQEWEAFMGLSQYLGFLSKGLKRKVSVQKTELIDNPATPLIAISKGDSINLKGNRLTFSSTKATLKSFNYLNLLSSASLTVLEAKNPPHGGGMLSLEKLGVSMDRSEYVDRGSRRVDFTPGVFGGIPVDAELIVKSGVFQLQEDQQVSLSIFLNDRLIKDQVFNYGDIQSLKVKLPEAYFEAFNALYFEWKLFNSNCNSFGVSLFPDSGIHYTSVRGLTGARLNEFPAFLYADTLFVVSEKGYDEARAAGITAFRKGRSAASPGGMSIVTLEAFSNNESAYADYESFVFMLSPEDTAGIDPFLDLSAAFKILDTRTDEVLYSAKTEDEVALAHVFEYDDRPALLISSYKKKKNSTMDFQDMVSRFENLPTNFAVFGTGQPVGFNLGEIYVVENANAEEPEEGRTFWERNSIWIITLVVFVLLLIIISSYRKTSAGR